MVRGEAGLLWKSLLHLAEVLGLSPVSKLNFSVLIFKTKVIIVLLLWGYCEKSINSVNYLAKCLVHSVQ